MTELRIETLEMPAADLGAADPLAAIDGPGKVGGRTCVLPYTLQNDYGRQRTDRKFVALVLENEILRATVLPELGGRLWSLYHKPAQRELLYVNPVFQPANLAVRGAWFSGGVEWNIGVRGHSPFTAGDVFAARAVSEAGEPVLRLYEWERIRRVPFQIDLMLPEGSAFLLARVRLVNPLDEEVPMYWWSNIAVPEQRDLRVLAPATEAGSNSYGGKGLRTVSVPVYRGEDISYATNTAGASDLFFHVPEGDRPWIAGLYGDGSGLIHTSTGRLKGRKLFQWGMSAGGRNWQEFLSVPDRPYVELQGGLATTQHEYVPMPAGACWEWVEAYGLLAASAGAVHGPDWERARQEVASRLERMLPARELRDLLEATGPTADRAPEEILHRGSGWGALEARRGEKADLSDLPASVPFDAASITREQAPWLVLLEDGILPCPPPTEPPATYMVQPEWRDLLTDAVAAGRGDHWFSYMHLGVMHYHDGRFDEALAAWETSIARTPNVWSVRNLAVLAARQNNPQVAADLYLRAWEMMPDLRPLSVECASALLEAGRPDEVLRMYRDLTPALSDSGRWQLLRANAALQQGDLKTVERVLHSGISVPDIREGEVSLTDLWFQWQAQRLARAKKRPVDDALRRQARREFPAPRQIDYRMRVESHDA